MALTRYIFSVQKDIDLPQIVVIGSQSVGKSSLIESMSGVRHLPIVIQDNCTYMCRTDNTPQRYWDLYPVSVSISIRFSSSTSYQVSDGMSA
jgi:Dynamin family